MDLLSIILLAIGLAMDCLAVSLTKGLSSVTRPQWGYALLMAVCFGLYQGLMPLLSFFAGVSFTEFFDRWTHWIALILLGIIGGKMIYEGFTGHTDSAAETKSDKHLFSFWGIQVLAIATSIDAFATGVLFISSPQMLWLGVSVIALVSFLFSVAGYWLGTMFGKRFRFNANLVGGLILIAIGLKIFIEHYI